MISSWGQGFCLKVQPVTDEPFFGIYSSFSSPREIPSMIDQVHPGPTPILWPCGAWRPPLSRGIGQGRRLLIQPNPKIGARYERWMPALQPAQAASTKDGPGLPGVKREANWCARASSCGSTANPVPEIAQAGPSQAGGSQPAPHDHPKASSRS